MRKIKVLIFLSLLIYGISILLLAFLNKMNVDILKFKIPFLYFSFLNLCLLGVLILIRSLNVYREINFRKNSGLKPLLMLGRGGQFEGPLATKIYLFVFCVCGLIILSAGVAGFVIMKTT